MKIFTEEMQTRKHLLQLYIIFFCLSTFYFYSPVKVNLQYLKAINWCAIFIATFFSLRLILKVSNEVKYLVAIKLLLLSIFISILSAKITWDQPITLTIRSSLPYLNYVFFIFLWQCKPKVQNLEKIVWVLCFVYIACFFYALKEWPIVIFGSLEDNVDDSRGIVRLSVPGTGFLYLGYFIAAVKYKTTKKNLWFIILLLLFVVISMHVTRQYIILAFIIVYIYIIKEMSFKKKSIITLITLISIYFAFQQFSVLQNLSKMTEEQVAQNRSNDEDVRIKAYNFFLFNFSPNIFNAIVGNGVPHVNSEYGKYYLQTLNMQMGLYMTDVGYAEIYSLFGILGLCSFGLIIYRSLKQKIPPIYMYAKLYIVFVFGTTFLSGYFLNSMHAIASICIVLYIMEIINKARIVSFKIT